MIILVLILQDTVMTKVYLSLGSNIGDSIGHLNKVITLLNNSSEVSRVKCSSFYETAPQGYTNQDFFINCVVECYTMLVPLDLLEFTQSIERRLKRVKLFRWGPRIIDVDILLYGDEVVNTDTLIIPHPRMFERGFVIIPLAELNSDFNKYINKVTDQRVNLV